MQGLTLKSKLLDIDLGKYQVLLHADDAEELGVHPSDRVRVTLGGQTVIAIVEATDTVVKKGEIGVFSDLQTHFDLDEGAALDVRPAEKPESVHYIKKKMHGKK